MKILAIETSCDETAASVVVDGREVKSNIVSSQIELHKKFGGVVPEVASRKHIENISQVIDEALEVAKVNLNEIDGIAVTYGPGLVGALLVGVATAKTLAYVNKKPLIPVHHIEGHIAANYIAHKDLQPPFLCVVVSGGHTHLVHVKDYKTFEILGKTRDDAVGEAFDKVARTIGLGYPGGPKIDKMASAYKGKGINLPKAKVDGYDFSFSGIKSAVLNYINQAKMKNEEIVVEEIAKGFQETAIHMIVEKAMQAAKEYKIDTLAIAGGVAANSYLRNRLEEECKKSDKKLYYPPMNLCTDNAAMIGSAAYYEYTYGNVADMTLNAIPNLKIGM